MTAAGALAPGSVGERLGDAISRLREAGVDSPRLDAELMLAEATGAERAMLIADPEREIQAPGAARFGSMLARRLRREPLAYILGRAGFRWIELRVDRRVLIPRPETELLVELALSLEPRRVLDVGTGSGAIALALADELPDAQVLATDTSAGALELAGENAARLGLGERVQFEPGSVPAYAHFDLVLANLPYIPAGDWDGLAAEIREYEPSAALLGGPDGLDSIRSLLDLYESAHAPRPAAIALEVGAGQAGEVARLLAAAGFRDPQRRLDLAGIERVVHATV